MWLHTASVVCVVTQGEVGRDMQICKSYPIPLMLFLFTPHERAQLEMRLGTFVWQRWKEQQEGSMRWCKLAVLSTFRTVLTSHAYDQARPVTKRAL